MSSVPSNRIYSNAVVASQLLVAHQAFCFLWLLQCLGERLWIYIYCKLNINNINGNLMALFVFNWRANQLQGAYEALQGVNDLAKMFTLYIYVYILHAFKVDVKTGQFSEDTWSMSVGTQLFFSSIPSFIKVLALFGEKKTFSCFQEVRMSLITSCTGNPPFYEGPALVTNGNRKLIDEEVGSCRLWRLGIRVLGTWEPSLSLGFTHKQQVIHPREPVEKRVPVRWMGWMLKVSVPHLTRPPGPFPVGPLTLSPEPADRIEGKKKVCCCHMFRFPVSWLLHPPALNSTAVWAATRRARGSMDAVKLHWNNVMAVIRSSSGARDLRDNSPPLYAAHRLHPLRMCAVCEFTATPLHHVVKAFCYWKKEKTKTISPKHKYTQTHTHDNW